MIVLFSHVRTGRWASIMPRNVAESFGFPSGIRIIPIVEPEADHLVGLVATHREPFTPLVSALLHEARMLAEVQEAAKLYPADSRNDRKSYQATERLY